MWVSEPSPLELSTVRQAKPVCQELPSTASETTSTAGTRDSSTSTLGEKILGVCVQGCQVKLNNKNDDDDHIICIMVFFEAVCLGVALSADC